MKQTGKVKLPVNVKSEDIWNFSNLKYSTNQMKVFEIRDAIITYDGICINDREVNENSIPGDRDKKKYYTMKATMDVLNNNTYLLDDSDDYLVVQGPIFSFFNWINDTLPRFLSVYNRLDSLNLLLPYSLKKISFVQDCLRVLPLKGVYYLKRYENVKVRRLIMPQLRPYCTLFNPEVVTALRDFLNGMAIDDGKFNGNTRDIIFLGDEKQINKSLVNASEFLKWIGKMDIPILPIAGSSLNHLMNVLDRTNVVISLGSDDSSCINFLRKGSSVFELLRSYSNEIDAPDLKYLCLASCLDLKYYYQFCDPGFRKYPGSESKLRVDMTHFERTVSIINEDRKRCKGQFLDN
jgi:hypothetical protein